MHKLYLTQLEIARNHESSAEALSYLSSILRSLLQSLALSALEIALEATPVIDGDLNFNQFLDRFSQPSDGLPVEILDALVPRIRGYVFRSYMKGWFESADFDKTIVSDLIEWVEFRNKRPGHGVLDAPTTALWAKRTGDLIQRILEADSDALPQVDGTRLDAHIGDLIIPITTPLVIDGNAMVIGKIIPRSGIWKIQGQILSWIDAREITIDLGPSNIFETGNHSLEKFKWSEVPTKNGSTLILNNVPVRQTSTFVGRKKSLEKLAEWLKDIVDSRACLVFGDGGYGKTTLVLEFLNNLLEDGAEDDCPLPTVISFYTAKKTKWTEEGLIHFKGISDAMEDSIRELIYCFDPVLGKEWYKIDGRALIEKVATRFTDEGFSRDDVILIIDNAETLATSTADAEELADFIARVAKRIGRVIITSRRRELLAAEPVGVSQLAEPEALQLIKELGVEYGALAINMAGESTLRKACQQLMYKPLLIDTLVRYIARSSSSIQDGLDQILRKTNDELLEFLYEDAWARMNALVKEVFMVLVSLASPLDGRCVGDVCKEVGVQHAEFQASLGETYFATIVDRGESYDLEIVDLANKFFLQKKRRAPNGDAERFDKIAFKVDKQATERYEIDKNYRLDRVADAFRSEYAKAAKIATIKKDYESAKLSFDLAILDEPLNAALQERYASFQFRILGKPEMALKYALRATELDPHSDDAWLTLGLIKYKLNDLENGDFAMGKAMEYGKAESLCLLQKTIARYHIARKEPYSRRSVGLLKEAETLGKRSMAVASNTDYFYHKNRHETEKYLSLIHSLKLQINRREATAKNSPEIS